MRTEQNLQVINAIAQKNFNPEILEKYTGYGGIGRELAEYDYYKKLNSIIPKAEIDKIKETTKTAYYTPELLVKFIYQALDKLGFVGGNILEPAAGNGAFIKHMPKNIRNNSKVTAIECEPVAFNILKALYPDIKSINNKLEDTILPNNSFDLVIGNPPYSAEKVIDERNPDLATSVLTDYFVARSVRLLKKGGVLAFVVNQYFLDMIRDHIRDVIAQEGASLIAAYRMPDNIFTGARVTTDVIFITKGTNTNKWINTKPYRHQNQTKYINEYYVNNPQNILGNLDAINIRGRTHLVCKANGSLNQKLAHVIKKFPSSVESQTKNSVYNHKEDLPTRVHNYIDALLSKHWDELLKLINLKRNSYLFDNIFLKLKKPNHKIQYIKSEYSLNLNPSNTNNKTKSDILVETKLDEKDYYFEIKLFFTKRIIGSDMFNIESTIECFLKEKIQNKFKYRCYFSYI